MITIFSISAFFVLLYLAYPLWLAGSASEKPSGEKETEEVSAVSLILLSYNGKQYLHEKISFLINELSLFKNYELIIIDDNSMDGSIEILEKFRNTDHVKIIINPKQNGIPFSMNLGVSIARFDYLIFCDQRQILSSQILKRIVGPLKFANVGAVSACISCKDKANKISLIRKHENFIKSRESNYGSVIGVYGPLYALKKRYYCPIPENIILDDLYLSLCILKSKQIRLLNDCEIVDDSFCILFDYQRARRYLGGLLQILRERSVFNDLGIKHRTMLLWHKYLRLFIPVLLFLCYISLGLSLQKGVGYVIAFTIVTIIALVSLLPAKYMFQFRMKNLIRMNILYFTAFIDILINDILIHKNKNHNKTGFNPKQDD